MRTVLTIDEQDVERGIESDMHLRCFRSNAGTLYLTRDTAARNDAASSFEAFVELWRKGRRVDSVGISMEMVFLAIRLGKM